MHKLSRICITLFVEFVKDLVATISVVISLKLIKHIHNMCVTFSSPPFSLFTFFHLFYAIVYSHASLYF